MTIAEFFVKLGFKVNGGEALTKIQGDLKTAADTAAKFAVAVDLGVGALTSLMYFAANAAVGLNKFSQLSRVSTDQLQQWEYAAAGFNVKAEEVRGSILGIQQAQAGVLLGRGNIGPWQFLGIDPHMDPLKVLWMVHERIQGLRPEIAQFMTSQMGISQDMFTALYRADLKLGDLQQKYVVTPQQAADLAHLNGQWEQMWMKIEKIGVKLSDTLTPAFRQMFAEIEPFIEKAANWLAWLGGDSAEAKAEREHLVNMTKRFLELAAAVTALSVALKALQAVSVVGGLAKLLGAGGAAAAGAGGEAAAAGAGGLTVGGVAAAIAGVATVAAIPVVMGKLKDPNFHMRSWSSMTSEPGHGFGAIGRFIDFLSSKANNPNADWLTKSFGIFGAAIDPGTYGVHGNAREGVFVTQHNDTKIEVHGKDAAETATKTAAEQARVNRENNAIGALAVAQFF